MIKSEVEKLLEKNAVEKCKKDKDQFVSSFFERYQLYILFNFDDFITSI